MENWRASHAHILNTFRQILYNRRAKVPSDVVQRLKRMPTIAEKLTRDPNMRVRPSQMQDIAGCRVIFPNLEELYRFKSLMDEGKFDHILMYEKDYISDPKNDGYRGIHQIYQYQVAKRPTGDIDTQKYNGMRVEIQYRTLDQHIWSTAVETIGLLTENSPKFNKGQRNFQEFFLVCSEIIARTQEGNNSALSSIDDKKLIERFDSLNNETHIFQIFENVNAQVEGDKFNKTSILIFYYAEKAGRSRIEVRSFDSVNAGIKEYNTLESDLGDKADVVLVKAEDQAIMRSAYRNYFADTAEFIATVREGAQNLRGP